MKTHSSRFIAAALLSLGLATNAHALLIQAWDFVGKNGDEASVNATTVNGGLQTTAITRGAGISAAVNADSFSGVNWSTFFDSTDYFQFSVSPQGGYQFSVSSISFNIEADLFNGPREWALRSDLDTYATNLDAWSNFSETAYTHVTDLSGNSNFQDVASARTFRLYAFNGSADFYYGGLKGAGNDLAINGSVVPEPSSWALLGTGALVLGWLRRRKKS